MRYRNLLGDPSAQEAVFILNDLRWQNISDQGQAEPNESEFAALLTYQSDLFTLRLSFAGTFALRRSFEGHCIKFGKARLHEAPNLATDAPLVRPSFFVFHT
jgi:hypothetical protein